MSWLARFLDSRLIDGGEVVSLTEPRSLYSPRKFLVLIFAKSRVHLKDIVPLEGLGELKNPLTS
jgi:hypothetical protein